MCMTGNLGKDVGIGFGAAALGPLLLPMAPFLGPAVLDIMGQTQQRKAEVDYANKVAKANRDQMDENRDIATTAYLDQAYAANRNLAETQEQTAAENFDKGREAMKARADVLTSAGEAGVGGGSSLQAILSDFNQQENIFRQRNEQNLLFQKQQTAAQVSSYYSEAKARTASIKPIIQSPIKPVDYVGPLLKAGNDGFGMIKPFLK